MEDPALVKSFLRDVVFLEAVGINPIIVHGGGKEISGAMESAGLVPNFINGFRVTDNESIKIVVDTLSKKINPVIVDTINELGGKATGVMGYDVFRADRMKPHDSEKGEDIDIGFVGKVTSIVDEAILDIIKTETVPVVTPIAVDSESGDYLNVNADLAASALACHLKTEKLVYISDVRGVLEDPSNDESLISTLSEDDITKYKEKGVISGGMLPKVSSALDALKQGVGKVHMIDGRIEHSLILEIFTKKGIGTQIVD